MRWPATSLTLPTSMKSTSCSLKRALGPLVRRSLTLFPMIWQRACFAATRRRVESFAFVSKKESGRTVYIRPFGQQRRVGHFKDTKLMP